MNASIRFLGAVVFFLGSSLAWAQVTISPLSSFGGGDGWLSPAENGYSYLGTNNTERGIAYGNGHLYLVSRSGDISIRVLDPLTGVDLGTPLLTTGISGGTFAVNNIAVGDDGVIYVANLTTQSTTTSYKVYKWTTESSTPVLAYSGNGGLAGARIGDNLSAVGSGSSTRLVAGYSSNPSVTGNNGFAVIDPTLGSASAVTFTGTAPSAGDFRLGITFAGEGRVIGSRADTLSRLATFAGTTATLEADFATGTLLAYEVVGGLELLAAQSTTDGTVSFYDISDINNIVLLGTVNNTSGTVAVNTHRTGELAWSDPVLNPDGTYTACLYALSANQGIQAFLVVVPEPGTGALLALAFMAVALGRRLRR